MLSPAELDDLAAEPEEPVVGLAVAIAESLVEEIKTLVTGFITALVKEVFSEYEFLQAGEHKSHLLMNVLDNEALEAKMNSDLAKEWGK